MHIIDLKGVGVKHLWSLRSYLQKLGATATAHYPEAVEKIFVSLGYRFLCLSGCNFLFLPISKILFQAATFLYQPITIKSAQC